jgi:2-haloacid dehalogenase
MESPEVIVFDVNETLSDMSAMTTRFTDVGAPAHLAALWFAVVLREGFARTVVDDAQPFATIGAEVLREMLEPIDLDRDPEAAVDHILTGFLGLTVHPDVGEGVRSLRSAGLRLVTLSNGAARVAESLLGSAGLRDQFEHLLSVEDAGAWKPDRRAYEYAAGVCGTDLARMLMVAVHPWDLDGAARAGMSTAWLNRGGGRYPGYAAAPSVEVAALPELAQVLARS